MDYCFELYNLIFETRKNDDVTYNDYGKVKCINNITDITDEFLEVNDYIKMLNYYFENKSTLYQSAFDSYKNRSHLDIFERTNYILGMTYTKIYENNNCIYTEKELGNIINKRWNNFKSYVKTSDLEDDFMDDFSFLGILDQTNSQYYKGNCKRKK